MASERPVMNAQHVSEDQLEDLEELQTRLCGLEGLDRLAVANRLTRQGVVFLGVGSGRIGVHMGADRVAKIAWNGAGLVANEVEARIWVDAPEDVKAVLCPVLELRPSKVLIQTECVPVQAAVHSDDLVRRLAGYGITDSTKNMGVMLDSGEERLVCYDYATISVHLFQRLFAAEHGHLFGD